ncbi:MAG: TetR/AcrR family transcriptional regulator [Lachnospiraceae bacterium]|nr:TetR/AcrR family transcriptional regulator [Lachnospiraceae bacterium]
MNDKFFDLKKEKQDRIINAALSVFADYGYRFASTDDIVREAHISKGLLFHYFESKLGLYTFLYDYSVRYFFMELDGAVNPKEMNLFTLYRQLELAKLQVLKIHPYLLAFLDKADYENVSEARLAIEERQNEYHATLEKIALQPNMHQFLPGVEGEKVQTILRLTLRDLMLHHLREHSFNAEMLYEESMNYISLLQHLGSEAM